MFFRITFYQRDFARCSSVGWNTQMTAPKKAESSETRLRAQQAKEFVIAQVVEQAKRENVPLSEIERRMLYFTESYDPPPDIVETNDEFERDYDSADYEKKIAGLLRNARERNKKESPEAATRWKQAVADIRKEDHYLLVMLDQSANSSGGFEDFYWVFGIALIIMVVGLGAMYGYERGGIRGRMFDWLGALLSRNPFDTRVEILILVLVGLGIRLVYTFAKAGELRNVAINMWNLFFGWIVRFRSKNGSRE